MPSLPGEKDPAMTSFLTDSSKFRSAWIGREAHRERGGGIHSTTSTT